MNTQDVTEPNKKNNIQYYFDVVIVGTGLSGLTAALDLSYFSPELKIALVSKSTLSEGSSAQAQGGIAVVWDASDSIESHIEDTLRAGAGLCHRDAVEFTVKNAKSAIEWLIDLGVKFTTQKESDGQFEAESQDKNKIYYHLTQEGGHSCRRIIHVEDSTGRSVMEVLVNKIKTRMKTHPIFLFENHMGVDLITTGKNSVVSEYSHGVENLNKILGLYVLNQETQEVLTFCSPVVLLSTGGASRVYLYSTNPEVSSGDGIAMAYRAGCRVANLEFNQFHPTCLYHPKAGSFLISEALRGEGAILKLPNGEKFMSQFHEKAELAPRDIVARAIDHEMKRLGLDFVYLDISHQDKKFILEHFPNIYEKCKSLGIDITEEPIPVVPAAHYTCGGVMINQKGQTDIQGLYAAGEVAFTGLHGANRMASNSLLECLVYAKAAASDIKKYLKNLDKLNYLSIQKDKIKYWDDSQVVESDEAIVIKQNWDEVRQLMWNYVGVVRSDKRLARAKLRIELLKKEIDLYYANFKVDKNLLELRNLVLLADLIIQSAMLRRESRGLHFNQDVPDLLPIPSDTVLNK